MKNHWQIIGTLVLLAAMGVTAAACVQPTGPTAPPAEASAIPTGPTAPPTTAQPSVRISPTSGPPGSQVQVMAQGFPPTSKVEIGIGRVNSEYDIVATAQTNAEGQVDVQIQVPSFVEAEDQWVIVVATPDTSVKAISGEFDVSQMPTPTSGEVISRTNVYMVAIGDEGQSGMEIGCGDSLVPVQVQIEASASPLTATLEALLAIESREYGQSGLYNALYQSELSVESVRFENGEAAVHLSGTLRMGGVCDEPRVRAQLRQCVLQYDTVDQVSFWINGTPLDELLGQGPEGAL